MNTDPVRNGHANPMAVHVRCFQGLPAFPEAHDGQFRMKVRVYADLIRNLERHTPAG